MKMRLFFWFLLGTICLSAQNIEKKWKWDNHTIIFEKGNYTTMEKDSVVEKGSYVLQSPVLMLFPQKDASFKTIHIQSVNDSIFQFSMEGKSILATTQLPKITPEKVEKESLHPSVGITSEGMLRGVFGMCILLLIAYIFSSNRKKINWKTVGIGLSLQLLLAIGVLKISWVQWVFEKVGSVFLLILDFTKAGSEFVFGSLLDASSFGFIFVFQILPTIIFFSALTSLLFYFGK